MKGRVWVAVLAGVLVGACGGKPAEESVARVSLPVIDEAVFKKHIEVLASDEFEGRAPATPAEVKTIEYISREFRMAGLAPGNAESFYQTVPMVEITAAPAAFLLVNRGAEKQRFKYADDMVVWTKRVVPEVGIRDSELVFVGYGIVAPEYAWNDYAGLEMKGKTAVILINDPGFATSDPQLFTGKAMTYYGRWTYKFEEAARQGAAGAIIIHETEAAAYGWQVVRSSWTGPQLDRFSEDGNASRVAIEGWVSAATAEAIFKLAGRDLAALRAAASRRGFRGAPVDVKATVAVKNSIRRSNSSNVIGILRGTEFPNEYVIYTGHWDHLGINDEVQKAPDKKDAIYNGAIDNATGTAGLIVLAKAFKEAKPAPRRSVIFLATTGEESGLLGSAHYAEHPLYPLERTAAAINLDALYEGGPTREISVIGFGNSELDDYLREAALAQDRVIHAEPHPERGSYYRSDHFNLAKKGVPALYAKLGMEDREKGLQFGEDLRKDYGERRYHQLSDEYHPEMDFRGTVQDLQLLYAVGYRAAQQRHWPNWRPGREFRAIRDASQTSRGGP